MGQTLKTAAALMTTLWAGAALADAHEGVPASLRCAGNEPGWVLSIAGADATLTRMGDPAPGGTALTGAATALDFLDPPARLWRGASAADTGDLVAVVTERQCFDTMADGPAMPFSAIVSAADGAVLTGCCRVADDSSGMAGLAGTNWQVVALPGDAAYQPGGEGEPPTLLFGDDGQVGGHSGCNRFFGPFRDSGDALAIGPLASTRMACPPPLMALETAFLAALEATDGYRLEAGRLSLTGDGGTLVELIAVE